MSQSPDDRLIAEQASQWLERLMIDHDRAAPEFVRWLLESRRHVRSFLLMTALNEELRKFDPERRLAIPIQPTHC